MEESARAMQRCALLGTRTGSFGFEFDHDRHEDMLGATVGVGFLDNHHAHHFEALVELVFDERVRGDGLAAALPRIVLIVPATPHDAGLGDLRGRKVLVTEYNRAAIIGRHLRGLQKIAECLDDFGGVFCSHYQSSMLKFVRSRSVGPVAFVSYFSNTVKHRVANSSLKCTTH